MLETTLDETGLRRPEFSEGPKVKLCDGQEWTFPRPVVGYVPFRVNGVWQTKMRPPYGDEFADGVNRMMAMETETIADMRALVAARFGLAAELLCRNYDLDDAALVELMAVTSEEASLTMWAEINSVVTMFATEE